MGKTAICDMTLLLVDDQPITLKMLVKILSLSGFTNIITAEDGEKALKIIGERYLKQKKHSMRIVDSGKSVDLVLLDVIMPGKNGFEICEKIKQNYPEIPVVLLTSLHAPEDQLKGIEVGAEDFISKPFNAKQVVARVNLLLNNKLRQDQLFADYFNLRELYETLPVFWRTVGKKISDYSILKRLGRGAMSVVYKAEKENEKDAAPVAIKVMNNTITENPDYVTRFRQEIEAINKLEHPNIIEILDYGIFEGHPYCVMEYICGWNLKEVLHEHCPMDFQYICNITMGVAKALISIHELNIVHRDIKLENIFYTEQEVVKLSDFGLAVDVSMTWASSGIVGTPIYMAPELVTGTPPTSKADVYAFGVTLYYALTGRPPFQNNNIQQLIYDHCKTSHEPVENLRKNLPKVWADFINNCLAKEPEARPNLQKDLLDKKNKFLNAEF